MKRRRDTKGGGVAAPTPEPSPVISGSSHAPGAAPSSAPEFFTVRLKQDGRPPTLREVEAAYVERLLALTRGNRSQAARLLDISYPTIAKKIADYAIDVRRVTMGRASSPRAEARRTAPSSTVDSD